MDQYINEIKEKTDHRPRYCLELTDIIEFTDRLTLCLKPGRDLFSPPFR
jgi:hypothetical protein